MTGNGWTREALEARRMDREPVYEAMAEAQAKGSLAEGEPITLAGGTPETGTENTVPLGVKEMLPEFGLFRTSDHRYYHNRQGPLPSVTTILEVLDRPALNNWKQRATAKVIFRDSKGFFGEGWSNGEEQAVKWAIDAIDEERDKAANIGSSVHLLADLYARQGSGASETASTGFHVSDEQIPYVKAWQGFQSFLEACGARIVSSEHAVWNEVDGYAGTYDLIVEFPTPFKDGDGYTWDGLALLDIKTSKGLYRETALQLAGYRWGREIIVPGSPQRYAMPEIAHTGILHLRPDKYPDGGWKLYPVPTALDPDFIAFMSVLDIYRWNQIRTGEQWMKR